MDLIIPTIDDKYKVGKEIYSQYNKEEILIIIVK